MTTISGISSTAASALNATSATTPAVDPSPSTAGWVQDSVTISGEAGVIGALAGSPLTYSATGLLNSFETAGTLQGTPLSSTTNQSAQAIAQDSTEQGIVGSLSYDPSLAGVYDASGTLQSGGLNSSWATTLSSNPSMSDIVVQDAMNQGIVRTL